MATPQKIGMDCSVASQTSPFRGWAEGERRLTSGIGVIHGQRVIMHSDYLEEFSSAMSSPQKFATGRCVEAVTYADGGRNTSSITLSPPWASLPH